ncbi:unnamed protein product [Cylindrotheca closterium]|uniref:Uncharacterized protein n=1 Tax=Cylindrotheca closterium TaxID=2856 RepID=A0AAD2JG89_9STRA|nr:unnamed protein product [Cylindrotheca closterium]
MNRNNNTANNTVPAEQCQGNNRAVSNASAPPDSLVSIFMSAGYQRTSQRLIPSLPPLPLSSEEDRQEGLYDILSAAIEIVDDSSDMFSQCTNRISSSRNTKRRRLGSKRQKNQGSPRQ